MSIAIDFSTLDIRIGIYYDGNTILIPKNEYDEFTVFDIQNIDSIMQKIKNVVESCYNLIVQNAVIAIPNNFGNIDRQLIVNAGKKLNIDIRLINNTSAAAIGYNHNKKISKKNTIIIDTTKENNNLNMSIIVIEDDIYEVVSMGKEENIDLILSKLSESSELYMRISKNDINQIIFICNDTTLIPKNYDFINEYFKDVISNKTCEILVQSTELVIFGAIMVSEPNDIILLDITSYSLGIGIMNNKMENIINRFTIFPTSVKDYFTYKFPDGNFAVELRVYEGESKDIYNNKLIGKYIPEHFTPFGSIWYFDMFFNVDRNGILDVKIIHDRNKFESKN